MFMKIVAGKNSLRNLEKLNKSSRAGIPLAPELACAGLCPVISSEVVGSITGHSPAQAGHKKSPGTYVPGLCI